MSDEESPTLWQRARRRAHEEIAAVAMTLFLENGFAETTVDQIAAAAGIGRRSFFRYFGSKEDVVIGVLVADAALLRTELERQPEDRDAWAALTGAVLALDDGAAERERALEVARMVYDTPSLRARSIEKHLRWYDELAPEVERRLGGRTDATLRARAIVATFATCLDIAGEAWVRDGGTGTLRTYLDAALSAVRT